jgi:aspartyl aminopeptidase
MEPIHSLCAFLDGAHSVYHAVALIREELDAAGYTALSETEEWNLQIGGKYYVVRNGSAVIAFRVPTGAPKGFLFSTSHTDRPCFKVK